MGVEDGGGSGKSSGKGIDRLRAQQDAEANKFSGELKGKGLKEDESVGEDVWVAGKRFINRDAELSDPTSAEFEVTTSDGEKGKRHIVLKNTKTGATVGRNEQALNDSLARGVWREK